MKDILRYILPIAVVAMTIWCGAEKPVSIVVESRTECAASDVISCYLDSSNNEESLLISLRITSTSSVVHLQNATKRTNNAHKNNFEFTKSGKLINSCIENVIYKKSLVIASSFTKPIHRLISLGKLII